MMRLKSALACALLAACVWLVVSIVQMVRGATAVILALPATVQATIREQGDATRAAAMEAIAQTRREALEEIARTRADLFARVDRLTDVSERSVADLTARADEQLSALNAAVAANLERANESVAEVSAVVSGARPVLDHAASVTAQVDDAMPLFLDCDHNPNCVFNRYVGVAQSTERAMRSVAETAPGTLRSIESTAGSVASIAKSWEKQTPLYVRVIGWIGGGVWRLKALFD